VSNNSNKGNIFGEIAALAFGLLAFVIWQFSSAINVNFETGVSVLLRVVVVLAVCFVLLKFGFSLGQVIPGMISGLAFAFFPALDYWSAQAIGGFSSGFSLDDKPMWYACWYAKGIFVLVPSLGGYTLHYALSR
jgi:hypothetical protein